MVVRFTAMSVASNVAGKAQGEAGAMTSPAPTPQRSTDEASCLHPLEQVRAHQVEEFAVVEATCGACGAIANAPWRAISSAAEEEAARKDARAWLLFASGPGRDVG